MNSNCRGKLVVGVACDGHRIGGVDQCEPVLSTPRPLDLLIALGVGVLGIVIPYSLELFALRRLPVKTVSTMLSLDAAIAAIVGTVALGQVLSLPEPIGIVLVMAASAGAVATQST